MNSRPIFLPYILDISQSVINPKFCNGIDIVFENISFSVSITDETVQKKLSFNKKYKQKPILRNVSGIFKAGRMTAIMGASGAGKTTLLNILACRIQSTTGGKLYANNLEYSYESFGNFANYVMQTDRLMETLTVRETLEFAAKLKLNHLSKFKRKVKVLDLVKKMKLQKCLDTLVGGVILKGISGGQKKRVSIAFELISDPQVIFLDEPTSGLDSLTSYIICSELRKLAHCQIKTVIMTIHQPGMETFNLFDDLLVLLDGKFVYQNKASMITNYFDKHFSLRCPQFMNPPDYCLSQIHYENSENRVKFSLFFQIYDTVESSSVYQKMEKKLLTQPSLRKTSVPFFTALSALINRSFINTMRNPYIIQAKILQAIVIALFIGGIYFNFGKKDYTDYQSWLGISGFFFMISVTSLTMSIPPIALTFPQQRLVFLKEQDNRMYNTIQYFIAKNIVEIPQHFILPLLCASIYYFMFGCAPTLGQFFLHCLIYCLMSYCGASIGLFIGSIITDWKDIPVAIPLFLLPLISFSGFFKNRADLPEWIGWIEFISPNKYSFMGLLENQVVDRDSLIQRLNFDISQSQAVWLMLILGFSYRMTALITLSLLKKKTQ